jgi:hypothetical protein
MTKLQQKSMMLKMELIDKIEEQKIGSWKDK